MKGIDEIYLTKEINCYEKIKFRKNLWSGVMKEIVEA